MFRIDLTPASNGATAAECRHDGITHRVTSKNGAVGELARSMAKACVPDGEWTAFRGDAPAMRGPSLYAAGCWVFADTETGIQKRRAVSDLRWRK